VAACVSFIFDFAILETWNEHRSRDKVTFAMGKLLTLPLCLCVAAVLLPSCRAENAVFDSLLSQGVQIGPHEVVRLAPPTLADGLNAAQQRRAIEALPESGHSWAELTRRSVVAPIVLKISKDDESQQRMCCHVDVWFVAHGTMAALRNIRFLQSEPKRSETDVDAENGVTIKPLPDGDLVRRGLRPPQHDDELHYFADELRLLGRVRLAMTTKSATSETQDSILSASMLDMRFANDAQFPNFWRPVSRDDSGRRTLGPRQPFSGYGGYAKATKLVKPAGAIFIEYHLAFAEPEGWFGGSNALRSKLPLVAQYVVRQLRQELEKSR
jgi:hypothetical protein